MKIRSAVWYVGVLLVACSVQATSRVSLLPAKSDVIVSISSLSGLGEAMKSTSFGKLWNDPKIQEALGDYDFEKSMKEGMFSSLSEEQRHLYWEEIKMLTGEIACSVQVVEEAFTLIAEISEEDFKRSIVLDRRLSELDQANKINIHKSSYQGVDIYSHSYETTEKANSWQAYIDNTLLMSTSEDWVKKAIAAAKKSPIKQNASEVPSIVIKAQIASMIKTFTDKADAEMAKVKNDMPQGGGTGMAMPDFSPAKIVDAMGLSSLQELTIATKFHADRMTSQTLLVADKPLKGIFSMIDFTPSTVDLRIPYAPEGTISYEVSRIDLMALWKEIPQIINMALPASMAAQANGGLMMAGGMLGIDPGNDLFAHLDTQVVSTYIDAGGEPEGVFFMRLKNEEALKVSLEKVFAETGMLRMQMGEKFKIESFRDASLYEFETAATNKTFAFAAESGYLVLGSGTMLRHYLRAVDSDSEANQAFYKSRIFAELSKRVSSKSTGYSAMDAGKYVKVFLKMFEDNPAIKGMMQGSQAKANNPFPNFDINKLPSSDYMSKFFGYSFGQAEPSARGIKSKSVMYYEPM